MCVESPPPRAKSFRRGLAVFGALLATSVLSVPLNAQAAAEDPIAMGVVAGLSWGKVVVSGGGASLSLDGRTGIAAGATLTVPFGAVRAGRLSASLRYTYGMGDIVDLEGEAPGATIRNRSFVLLAGYSFTGAR